MSSAEVGRGGEAIVGERVKRWAYVRLPIDPLEVDQLG